MEKSNAAKLIKVTEYGKRLPPPTPPSRMAVQKEMDRMEIERQNLNAMERIAPNPLYAKPENPKPAAKKKFQGIMPEDLKGMTQEEIQALLDEINKIKNPAKNEDKKVSDILKKFSMSGQDEGEDAMSSMLNDYADELSTPQIRFETPSEYRFPGFPAR